MNGKFGNPEKVEMCSHSRPEISFSILASNLPMAMVFSFLNCYCGHITSNFKSFQTAHRDSIYTDRGPSQGLA